MEVYKNIKKGTKVGLIIAMIFVFLGIGTSIYNLIAAQQPPTDMVEAQKPTEEIVEAQKPTEEIAETQKSTGKIVDEKQPDEMNDEHKMAPAKAPEVPKTGVPGYVKDIISLVLYVLTGFYTLFGYKKPHGNLLKYLFIAFAISLILNVCLTNIAESAITVIISLCSCLAALILMYVSGRFHKIEKNRILLIVAGVMLFAAMLLPLFSGKFIISGCLNSCSAPIMLLALGFAYTARFEEHKAAGLE